MKHTTSLLIVLSIINSSVACGGEATATPEPSASESAAGKESSAQTEWKPSTELCSPDHEYCVKIVAKAQDVDHRELIVSSKARVLAKFPTFGYLMDAFWSPDNKYVAISNRRANAGDYLWVISLSNGAALKMPDDLATEMGKKNLGHISGDDPWGKTVKEVTTRFTECAHDRLDHNFLFAQGWESASDLLVLEELQFSNEPPQSATITAPGPDGKSVTRSVTLGFYGPGAPGIWIAVNKTCRVTGNKIALKRQTIEKHEHSSEFVNRAWTYGAYWMKSPAEDFFTSAQAKQAKGDLDGAIADYSRSLELEPKNSYTYYNRGNIKQAKGDLNGAISDYNSAIELGLQYADAYNNRGNAKGAKGDLDGAITDFNRALELNPKHAYAYHNRGLAEQAKANLGGAISDYNSAIELDPKYANTYADRGVAKQAKGDLDGAITDYDRAIELDPKLADAYNNRAWANHEKGEDAKGLPDAEEAVALAPKDANSIETRAEIYEKLGQHDKAVADYRAALKLNPNMKEAQGGLKRLGE